MLTNMTIGDSVSTDGIFEAGKVVVSLCIYTKTYQVAKKIKNKVSTSTGKIRCIFLTLHLPIQAFFPT